MRILACFAHPDDETMLAGGLLALLASVNFEVHFMSCTRGEGGECGDPPICRQKDLGRFREKELKCAVENLGGHSLTFLDYKDPLVGLENELFSFTDNVDELAEKIDEYLTKHQIDTIITHGSNGEYGHPGHLSVFNAVKKIVHNGKKNLYWYSVQAFYEHSQKPHLLNKDDSADWVIDTSVVVDKKIKAAYCHQSQHALFLRRKSKELGRLVAIEEVINAHESYHLQYGSSDILLDVPIIKDNIISHQIK